MKTQKDFVTTVLCPYCGAKPQEECSLSKGYHRERVNLFSEISLGKVYRLPNLD